MFVALPPVRSCRRTLLPLSAALVMFLGASAHSAPGNAPAAPEREVIVDLGPAGAAAEYFLSPGGPHLRAEHELGADARDVALVGDMAFIAAGRDGLLVVDADEGAAAGRRAQLSLDGAVSLIRAQARTALLAGAGGLYVVDIGDPDAPRLRQRHRTPAAPVGIALDGTRAWLLFEREVQALDLSADVPVVTARHPLPAAAYGLAAEGGRAYIAAGAAGLLMYDGGQAAPAVLRTTGPALDVAAQDGKVYVADGDAGVVVFDAGGNEAPRWLGSFRRLPALKRIAVGGPRALAAGRDGGLYLLDISRPEFPDLLAILPAPSRHDGYHLGAEGACVLSAGRLLTYELRAGRPRLGNEGLDFGQGVNLGGQRRVFIEGKTAYVADWFSGLHLYDIADPRRPLLLSSFHTEGSPKGVVVRDGYAYVADDDHGLQILDVRDPRRPLRIADLATPGLAYSPVLDGELLYLASHRGGFVIIDVADVHAPRIITHVDTPGKAWSLRVRDGVLYVADDDSGLLVFDVRDPHVPREIGRFNPGGAAEEVLLDGERAYVAFFDRGVHVLDISDPAAPAELGHVATPGNARGLYRRDRLLYVADWLAGVQVVDVSDAERPRIVGGYDTDGAAWGVQLHGKYAYVMDWWGGISVLDVSKPTAVRRAGGYPRQDTVRAVAVRDRFAFVAQGDAGLQVFDIANPLNPTWMTGVDLAGAAQVVTLGDRAYVLHGRDRLAELDISNPYQTRLIGDLPRARATRALYASIDRLLLTEDKAVTLYDPVERSAVRYPLDERISDAVYADGQFYLAVPGRGLVVAAPGHGRMTPLAAYPIEGEIKRLRVEGRRAYVHVAGEGVRILGLDDATLRETGRIPLGMDIEDMQVEEDVLYVVADGVRVYAFDVGDPAAWRIKNRYNSLGAVTGVIARGGFLYLAGSETLTALQALPPLALSVGVDGRGRASLPTDLPAGAYDLFAVERGAAAGPDHIVRRSAAVVEPLRFGKPKITPEQFKALLQQHLPSPAAPR